MKPLIVLFSILFSCPLANATDRFVSTSGSDTNSGTMQAPWATFQKAANTAKPGDTVYISGGTYKQRFQVNVNGTAAAPITFMPYKNETVTLDASTLAPPANRSAIVRIPSRNFITIKGLRLCNYVTSESGRYPCGILIDGASTGVQLLNNIIINISNTNATKYNSDASAQGIAVYGTSSSGITGLVIDGNELDSLRLGSSEALALNGNVSDFTISYNFVHRCNNTGIDLIGYEGTCADRSRDRPRGGIVRGNTLTAISSTTNPAYGGDLVRGGGAVAVAGIYLDGATACTVERNHVFACNFGIEIASEHAGCKTDYIVAKNNLLHHNHLAGLAMGGYDEHRGIAENCLISNNIFYQNDTTGGHVGQIYLQFYVRKNKFLNNIVWAGGTGREALVHRPESQAATVAQKEFSPDNLFGYNLYYANGGSVANIIFSFVTAGESKNFTLPVWQAQHQSGADAASVVANPRFLTSTPGVTSPAKSFALTSASPAVNSGSPDLTPPAGELDILGNPRNRAGRVDRGADEY